MLSSMLRLVPLAPHTASLRTVIPRNSQSGVAAPPPVTSAATQNGLHGVDAQFGDNYSQFGVVREARAAVPFHDSKNDWPKIFLRINI